MSSGDTANVCTTRSVEAARAEPHIASVAVAAGVAAGVTAGVADPAARVPPGLAGTTGGDAAEDAPLHEQSTAAITASPARMGPIVAYDQYPKTSTMTSTDPAMLKTANPPSAPSVATVRLGTS